MEKRKVTAMIGGQLCSFYSDDSEEYVEDLVRRANAVMRQTARFSGLSPEKNAALSVISLTDALMRVEREKKEGREEAAEMPRPRKNPGKAPVVDRGQVSVWELLEKAEPGKGGA